MTNENTAQKPMTEEEIAAAKAHEAHKAELEALDLKSGQLPVRLLKGYRPMSTKPAKGAPDTPNQKIAKGTLIGLPETEARKIVKAGIAERGDEF